MLVDSKKLNWLLSENNKTITTTYKNEVFVISGFPNGPYYIYNHFSEMVHQELQINNAFNWLTHYLNETFPESDDVLHFLKKNGVNVYKNQNNHEFDKDGEEVILVNDIEIKRKDLWS